MHPYPEPDRGEILIQKSLTPDGCDMGLTARSLQDRYTVEHTPFMETEPILVIVTGGTFDKHYDEIKGELTFRETHLPEILKQVRITYPVRVETNQLIDSLQMQDENRQSVLAACRSAPERRIIITHGTDTMTETAALLGQAGLEKTIILTGAMIPYKIQGSDALFNFGTAVAAVHLLPQGVYIAMNGQLFPWDAVRKDRSRGLFVEKTE